MNKKERLEELKGKLNLIVEGKENYPKDYSSIIVANHNSLKDIFYLPFGFDDEIVSLVSSRLIYKRDLERQVLVRKYLNAFPIEAHGGNSYSELCLENASKLISAGISCNIFPEGAYIDDKENVYKGRTGAARILFKSIENGYLPHFIPVSIDVESSSKDLDDYNLDGDKVTIKILEPIDYSSELYDYKQCYNKEGENKILHSVTDRAMKSIADSLGRTYQDEYIELFKKGNVIFENGDVIDTEVAQKNNYINRYEMELENRVLKLINNHYSNQ